MEKQIIDEGQEEKVLIKQLGHLQVFSTFSQQFLGDEFCWRTTLHLNVGTYLRLGHTGAKQILYKLGDRYMLPRKRNFSFVTAKGVKIDLLMSAVKFVAQN